MPEDLVFTIKEKTAPNFFPEILVPPRAVSSRGPNHRGEAGSGDGGNDGERGMAVVLSSDLTQCLGGVPTWEEVSPRGWYSSGSGPGAWGTERWLLWAEATSLWLLPVPSSPQRPQQSQPWPRE